MDLDFKEALIRCDTDVDEVLLRLAGDEELYCQCLELFLQDQTMYELKQALDTGSWDEAFTAAHALKGLAGNMGFIPFFQAAAEMVVLIRAGRTEEVGASYLGLKRCYDAVYKVVNRYCGTPSQN